MGRISLEVDLRDFHPLLLSSEHENPGLLSTLCGKAEATTSKYASRMQLPKKRFTMNTEGHPCGSLSWGANDFITCSFIMQATIPAETVQHGRECLLPGQEPEHNGGLIMGLHVEQICPVCFTYIALKLQENSHFLFPFALEASYEYMK